jgi:hypothetical protein
VSRRVRIELEVQAILQTKATEEAAPG